MTTRVLFVCTGNSARSQMAEYILRALGGDDLEVFSAGTDPRPVHPLTIRVLQEIHIDAGDAVSKGIDQFVGKDFDYIITVCDSTRDQCASFPGHHTPIHWGFDDPSAAEGDEENQLKAFRRVRGEIITRIRNWLAVANRR